MATPGFKLTEMADNQASPYATFNEAIRIIEAHGKGVVSRTTAAQPGSVTDGAAYILPASPTGTLWATFAQHDLVVGVGGTWKKYTPVEGWGPIWVNSEDLHVSFNGTSWIGVLTQDASGNVTMGTAAIATTATDGFLYVPSCAGVPTGTPTTKTGQVPIVADSTNNKLYIYSGGAWVILN